jgi:uncharacterized membrane protein YgdD (TMEM256/DUF423 family)
MLAMGFPREQSSTLSAAERKCRIAGSPPARYEMAMSDGLFFNRWSRVTVGVAALIGALGVASAAAASHGGDQHLLGAASTVCLAHAPVLLALGLFGLRNRRLAIAAALLGAGTIIFAADLALRYFLGYALVLGAAPVGGIAMISGWLMLVVASVRGN